MKSRRYFVHGRYKMLSELGFGGVSAVFKVYDRMAHRVCALKLLSPHIYKTDEGQHRLLREANVMKSIDHPGIVKLYALHEDPPALAMELIDGRSLGYWQRKHAQMPAFLVLKVAKEVTEAMAVLHRSGMIHRDIKPANILVTPTERCKLVDFGIARIDNSSTITQTGMMMGSHGFMAPEQVIDAKRVDHRADIYSLGKTLLSLLTGDPTAKVPDLLDQASQVASPEMCRLLMQMTIRHVERRLQTVEVLQKRLQSLPDEPVPARRLRLHIDLSRSL